ncbi:MAG TPA: hypothetical protein ENH91_10235 [Leeuwenhoekiella sp.]|nr:hypothetical protein [Leeuwenhoekiella sp.]
MEKALIIPTYLPTITTMAVLIRAHHVVVEIQDNYQKQSYRNRTYINTANGRLGLTIPVKHNHNTVRKKTADALIENNFLWQRQHWRSIQIAYRSSPFFEFYEDDLTELYHTEYEQLLDFNLKGIQLLFEMLNISKEFEMTTAYEKKPKSSDFRRLANAKKSNIPVAMPEYDQVFTQTTGFNGQVSVIDLIFNEGPNAVTFLQNLPVDQLK